MSFHSNRSLEGYLLIDDRCSGGQKKESATKTCSHCHHVLVLNPQRTRPRHYCSSCDHFICDACEFRRVNLGQGCVSMARILDTAQTAAFRAEQAHKSTIYLPPPLAMASE